VTRPVKLVKYAVVAEREDVANWRKNRRVTIKNKGRIVRFHLGLGNARGPIQGRRGCASCRVRVQAKRPLNESRRARFGLARQRPEWASTFGLRGLKSLPVIMSKPDSWCGLAGYTAASPPLFSSPMCAGVAHGAERDEVLFGIIAGLTAKLLVVDLQVRHRATRLTTPPIATQHLPAKFLIR